MSEAMRFHRGDIVWVQCDPSVGEARVANASLVMTYDRQRIIKQAGRISDETQQALDRALGLHLGLVPV